MKTLKAFTSCLVCCSFVVLSASQANAQSVQLGASGPTPRFEQAKTGKGIGFSGVRNGEFYGARVTSAPPGSAVSTGGDPQWLAGCLDFWFIPDVPGLYSYEVAYDAGTFTGSITATTGDTIDVVYGDDASGPVAFNVNEGDVMVFHVGYLKNCTDQVYLTLTSVPYGAANPVPPGSGYDVNQRGPLTYPVTVAGSYSYNITGTSGFPPYTGTITASAPAASVAGESSMTSGFSLSVQSESANSTSTIHMSTDRPADVQLALFDASGRQVRRFDDLHVSGGEYSAPVSFAGLSNGAYFLRASVSEAVVATAKVLILH